MRGYGIIFLSFDTGCVMPVDDVFEDDMIAL